MIKKKDKFIHYYIIISSVIFSLFLGFCIALPVYCSSFYVHESGHIVYGMFDNLIHGRSSEFQITNWISCPFLPFFKLPQQTRMIEGKPSLNFALGGIVAIILVSTFIAYLFFIKTHKKIYWLIPLIFTYHEFIGNFLCGTDNYLSKPFEICKNVFVKNLIYLVIPALTILIAILIYPKIVSVIRKKLKYK